MQQQTAPAPQAYASPSPQERSEHARTSPHPESEIVTSESVFVNRTFPTTQRSTQAELSSVLEGRDITSALGAGRSLGGLIQAAEDTKQALLTSGLTSSNPLVVEAAALALSKSREETVIARVCDALEENIGNRDLLTTVIPHLDSENSDVVQMLSDILSTDHRSDVRKVAATALKGTCDPVALAALEKGAASDEDPRVKISCTIALGRQATLPEEE